jgi:type 1 fimbria pilin
MRRTGRRAFLILLLLTACTSGSPDDPNAPQITLHLEQYESPNAYTFSGPVNVSFALSVANTTNQPVKLNRIEIRTVSSGAYSIRPTSTNINLDIAPGQSRTIPFSVWGYARGGQVSATEPVTVRATAYFTGPQGAFVRLFSEYFAQQ